MGVAAYSAGCEDGTAQRRAFERSTRVIGKFEPAIAGKFKRVTDLVLRDCAWTGGMLNRTGGPIEFSFGTCSDEVRYTVELGGLPAHRLGVAASLLRELGVKEPVHASVHDVQHGEELEFGAWLGVRHAYPSGGTSYKVYAEVPAGLSCAASLLAGDFPGRLPTCPARLVLLGAAPGSDRCEFYFEMEGRQLTLAALGRMLTHVGLESRQAELVELIRSFQFRREGGRDSLPEAQYGFSYSLLPGNANAVFSLFIFAADLAGGDGSLYRQALSAALSRGWTLGCYAAMTEPVSQWIFRSAFHNMISFVAGNGPVGFQVSVSPPPDLTEED